MKPCHETLLISSLNGASPYQSHYPNKINRAQLAKHHQNNRQDSAYPASNKNAFNPNKSFTQVMHIMSKMPQTIDLRQQKTTNDPITLFSRSNVCEKRKILEYSHEMKSEDMKLHVEPPELSLRVIDFSAKTRFEDNSIMYGKHVAMSLLPPRMLPDQCRLQSPSHKQMEYTKYLKRTKKKNSFELKMIDEKDSSSNDAHTKNSRSKSSNCKHQKLTQSDSYNKEFEKRGFNIKELEINLNKLKRSSHIVRGNPNTPTLGAKIFRLQFMNDEYLQPLIQLHKKEIFDTKINL